MAFITYDQLTNRVQTFAQEKSLTESASTFQQQDVFLSHSTKDHKYVPGVIQLLSEYGASTYVDDWDKRLPERPSHVTATIIRTMVYLCPRFIVLVSPNSNSSRWIPWELGLADAYKGVAPVAILPIAPTDTEQSWIRTEYFGLYPRIVASGVYANDFYVIDPRRKFATWELRQWLKGNIK